MLYNLIKGNYSQMKNKKLGRNLLIFTIGLAFVVTLVNQEQTLNEYEVSKAKLADKIEEAEDYKERLEEQKTQVDTPEFIEQTAREKLDMYYPNEVIYMDIEK